MGNLEKWHVVVYNLRVQKNPNKRHSVLIFHVEKGSSTVQVAQRAKCELPVGLKMVTLDKALIQYSYNLCMIPVIYQTTFLTCTSQETNTYSSAKFLILQSLTTSSEITLSQLALA